MPQAFPIPVIQWAQQQLSQFGRIGATRIITTPALPVVIPGVFGQLAQAPLITWRDDGTVIALYAQERAGTVAKFASTEVRVQFAGDEDLITNGNAGDFAPMLALVGPNTNWFPLTRRVARGDNWTITYRNQSVTPADPSVLFAFIADADLGRFERDMKMQKARG